MYRGRYAGGILVTGPADGALRGITVNMNDFSDQALTLAAIAPFADAPVRIEGIGHIRGQECDRIHAIQTNLTALGIRCEEEETGCHDLSRQPPRRKRGDIRRSPRGDGIFPGRT